MVQMRAHLRKIKERQDQKNCKQIHSLKYHELPLLTGFFVNKQEARRAAEKAYDVAKVDERVNRSVSAANRAANAARVAAVKAVQNEMHHHVNEESFRIPVL